MQHITFKVVTTTTGKYYLYEGKVVVSLEPLVGEHKGTVIGTQHFKEVFGIEPTYSTVIDDYTIDVRDLVSVEEVTMPIAAN